MSPVWTLLMLLLVTSFSGATQVFPQSYEFVSGGRVLDLEATCPDMMRNGENLTVCYYDSEIRPKLVDCDLGEGTYQDGGAYPLLYSNLKSVNASTTYKFGFTFDQPLHTLSSFTLHYYCSRIGLPVKFAHDLPTSEHISTFIFCTDGHQMKHFVGLGMAQIQTMTVTVNIHPATLYKGQGIFLTEVQFFTGADSDPTDPCTIRTSCCANEAVCRVNSTALNGYECVCPDGFSGVNCQFKDQCPTHPCQNRGNCTDHQGDYNCTCPSAYSGKNCEMELVTATKDSETITVTSSINQPTTSVSLTTSSPTTQNYDSSSSPTTAVAVGTVVSVFVVILMILGFVAVVVYYRRRKGKKGTKVIEHIGEDESNIYALVDKPTRKRNAPPAVPPQNFDPVEEGLDKMQMPPLAHSDPSTGQASTSPPVYANNKCFDCVDSPDPQEQSPPPELQTHPPGNTYETVDGNNPTPEDPYYSVPDTNGRGPLQASQADRSDVYEDTLSAPKPIAVFQNSVPVQNEDMYAVVN